MGAANKIVFAILAAGVLSAITLILLARYSVSVEVPPTPTQWVTDNANVLTVEQLAGMNTKLRQYQELTQHHLLVWIGETSDGQPDTFATNAFNAWGIGRHNFDDGVVLFVFTMDKHRVIRVGYGLEAAISDTEAVRICTEVIKPKADVGDYVGGIWDGVDAITDAITAYEVP